MLSCLSPLSHNTKTTSWLDPRCRDKASRPLEECDDDGKLLHIVYIIEANIYTSVYWFRNENMGSHTCYFMCVFSGEISA